MFASVHVKDYEIQLDGKPYTVKGERWLGVINKEDEENYFEGVSFDFCQKRYVMAGDITKTKAEFDAEAKSICYFK